MKTEDASYADRLVRESGTWWKRLLDVQRPYRLHLQLLRLGFTLEVGCGVGRNLLALGADRSVGVDHNARSVEIARGRGLVAFTPDDLRRSPYASPASFDALLLAHVLEHMRPEEAVAVIREYLPLVRDDGTVVVITPQEAGFRSDPTHVAFLDHASVGQLFDRTGIEPVRSYSFPFPRVTGRFFKYNEFVSIGRVRRPHQ